MLVMHWHRLPREIVDASSMEVFMVRLDEARELKLDDP